MIPPLKLVKLQTFNQEYLLIKEFSYSTEFIKPNNITLMIATEQNSKKKNDTTFMYGLMEPFTL